MQRAAGESVRRPFCLAMREGLAAQAPKAVWFDSADDDPESSKHAPGRAAFGSGSLTNPRRLKRVLSVPSVMPRLTRHPAARCPSRGRLCRRGCPGSHSPRRRAVAGCRIKSGMTDAGLGPAAAVPVLASSVVQNSMILGLDSNIHAQAEAWILGSRAEDD